MSAPRLARLARAAGVAVLVATQTSAGEVTGRATVIDGDTLSVGGTRIRLYGIDAPERGQPWGRRATDALWRLVGGERINCAWDELDRYGRALAVCLLDDVDVGGEMVAHGWALAYRRYSKRYLRQEAEARHWGLGIWVDPSAVDPETWRRHQDRSDNR